MNQDNFLWGLQITDGLTMELVSQMTVIAFGVGVICFICNLAYNYLYHGASQLLSPNEDKFPDMMEIARCLVLFFCLSIYTPIAQTIVGTMEVINEATSLTSERAQEFAQFMAQSAIEQGEMIAEYDKHSLQSEVAAGEDSTGAMQHELDKKMEEDEMTGVRSSVEKIVQLLNPANLATLVLHGISALLVGIIQVVILGIGVVIVKLLVILGPFVFAVSMLPVFQKQLSIWFGTLRLYGIQRHQYPESNHVADLQGHLYGKCRHGGRSYAADTIFRNGSRPDWCLLQLFLAILQNRRTQRCRENHFENRVNRHHGGHHRPDGRRSGRRQADQRRRCRLYRGKFHKRQQ